ncbi:MAG: hypothetical protein R3208_01845 [Ketobacteraceae bacterium]|nr:hypothetical protein [Ketobacteraceae bacterium]
MLKPLKSFWFTALILACPLAYGLDFYPLETPCNPVSVKTCALPLPSDVYASPDEQSPTGMRLYYPEGVIRDALLDEVPPTLTPQTVINGSSGYSAATSVLFELESEPDLSTLPEDGGESVIAINLTTGERAPVRAFISEYARSRRVAQPAQIVEIYPRARWTFGERYAVFLTKALKPAEGGDFGTSPGFAQALSADGSDLAAYYEPVISQFESLGYSRNELISATFFTVRDEREVTDKLLSLGKYVYDQEHPIRNVRVRHKIFGYIGAIVTGEVLVHNFRDQYGGMIYDTSAAEDNWIRFTLTLPRSAKYGPVPVSIFSHGIGLLKESGKDTAVDNARMGIATIGIDHPNHGSRSVEDGGYVMLRMQTPYVELQVGMMGQSPVDMMSLLKAVQTSIAEIDVFPKRFWAPLFTRDITSGDGIPDIDTSRIFYQGISLGGVLGSAFLAIAPDLKGAFLRVPGVGVTSILSGSALWDPFFSNLVPDIADGAEALLLKSAMQHEIDYADAINYVHYIRNPADIGTPKPIGIIAGADDGVVPNFSTIAFAELAGIPLVGEEYFSMPGTFRSDDFDNGFGVVQYQRDRGELNDFWYGIKVHFSSGGDNVEEDWIKRYILGTH